MDGIVGKEIPRQKAFVKVFAVNTEDLEKELNEWIKGKEKYHEIIDIELSSSQDKSVALVLYREIG